MGLATRLASIKPHETNSGCRTCKWLATISDADRKAWDQWLADKKSAQQLYEVATLEGLDISLTAFRHHLRHKVTGEH